jgi:hypothetical protein
VKWTVVWHSDAMNHLTEIWLRAADRNAVSLASHVVDQTLGQSPELAGEEFYGDRLFDFAPLSVIYRVSEPDCLVTVLQVWYQPEPVE